MPPMNPKNETCFLPISSHCCKKKNQSIKLLHLFNLNVAIATSMVPKVG